MIKSCGILKSACNKGSFTPYRADLGFVKDCIPQLYMLKFLGPGKKKICEVSLYVSSSPYFNKVITQVHVLRCILYTSEYNWVVSNTFLKDYFHVLLV